MLHIRKDCFISVSLFFASNILKTGNQIVCDIDCIRTHYKQRCKVENIICKRTVYYASELDQVQFVIERNVTILVNCNCDFLTVEM